jgi:hypothetical protein
MSKALVVAKGRIWIDHLRLDGRLAIDELDFKK